MKVFFADKDRTKILEQIHNAMGGRKLAELVSFNLKPGGLEVVISKLGTSVLHFREQVLEHGLEYTLQSEKIAFTHRAVKDEVTKKILNVIEIAGGKIS